MFRATKRVFKEGFLSFWRNFSNSFASIFSVTIGLLIISFILLVSFNLDKITKDVETSLKISVLVDYDYEADSQLDRIENEIKDIDGVSSVVFSHKDEELEYFLSLYDEEERELYMPEGSDNPMPHTFYVEILDPSIIQEVNTQLSIIDGVSETNYGGTSILILIDFLEALRTVGLAICVGLGLISIYLIYNTISLTIGNREKEIQIMRDIGAKNSFIRMPFMIAGGLIGFLGAVLPAVTTILAYKYLYYLLVLINLVFLYIYRYFLIILLIHS